MEVNQSNVSPLPGSAPRDRWPRRHPIATVLLVSLGLFIALVVAYPGDGDNDRLSVFLGLMILAAPVLFVFWLVTRWIDRRDERERAAMAVQISYGAPATASATNSGSPAFVSPPSPPVAPSRPTVSALEATGQIRVEAQGPNEPDRHVTLDDLLAMTPTEFEQLCVRALLNLGYKEVRRTEGSVDLAADITGQDAQGRSFVVQCKRIAPGDQIGADEIQTFIGMQIVHQRADRGVMMTTAAFTAPAIDLARQHDVVLVDGDDIVKVLNLMGSR